MAERISTDFQSLDNNELSQRGMAVVLALMENVRLANPPVTMAMLQIAIGRVPGRHYRRHGGKQEGDGSPNPGLRDSGYAS
jgi:hypothetical protein